MYASKTTLLFFSTPLYYFGMSAQIKMAIDRFFANNQVLRAQKKQAVLLAACGDTDSWALDALDAHYHAVCYTCIGKTQGK